MISRLARFAATTCLVAVSTLPTLASDFRDANHPIKHVLLVSIDGLHASDLDRFVATHKESALAKLTARGTLYTQARTPVPSDSFPGMLALITGGTPKSTGIMYDDSFDRDLSPAGSDCKTLGSEVVLDEAADVNDNDLNTKMDEAKLPRDPARACAVEFPHDYLRVNTIFEVIKAAGGRTVWSDKHPTYDLVNGPSGKGVDELIVPEINANGTTDSVPKTIAYDASRAEAVINTILGHDAQGHGTFPAPTIAGMNFQAVSVAQKLAGVGYTDAAGTPSAGLNDALVGTDASIGKLVAALTEAKLNDSTLVIISAKHGQSPIDPAARHVVDKKLLAKVIKDAAPGGVLHITEDTAAYVWLKDHKDADSVAKAIEAHAGDLGQPKVYAGEALLTFFNDPTKDSRMPDLMLQPVAGTIYTKVTASKIAEHGGGLDEDRHVGLLVVGPGVGAGLTAKEPVATTSVAPTLIGALGLDANALQSVKIEGTKSLPIHFTGGTTF